MILVFKELFGQGLNPELLRRGNKMYEMRIKRRKGRNPDVFFRDSWNLLNMKLEALVPAFALNVLDKVTFCGYNFSQ